MSTDDSSLAEESPLLGNNGDGTFGDAENTWNGNKDFEGLPWWQKPSVGWPSCCV